MKTKEQPSFAHVLIACLFILVLALIASGISKSNRLSDAETKLIHLEQSVTNIQEQIEIISAPKAKLFENKEYQTYPDDAVIEKHDGKAYIIFDYEGIHYVIQFASQGG